MSKNRDRQLAKRRTHQQAQKDRKRAALSVALGASNMRKVMEEEGYVPTYTGGWRKKPKPKVKQPRKDK
jgi:hypothetical protein